jgi:O-antigen/teichoic acid export membrane protein
MIDDLKTLIRDAGRKGFFHLLSANALIGFLGFGAQLLVAKLLTPIELGQIRTMQSFIAVATVVGGFGFNTAVLKLCSENRSPAEKAFIFRRTLLYSAVPIPIVLVILLILARSGVLSPDIAVNRWLPIYMLTIPAVIYTLLIMAYLQALKQIQRMATLQVAVRALGFVAVVLCCATYGLAGFVIAAVVVGTIALAPLWYAARPPATPSVRIPGLFSQSMNVAGWSVAANTVNTAGGYMDILLLNFLTTDRAGIGYYGIATIFIMGINQLTATVQTIATPYFSEKGDNVTEFKRVLWKYQKLLIIISAIVTAVSALTIPPLIATLYGDSYSAAGVYFRILTLKYFLWSCYALLGQAVLGMGLVRYNFFAALVQVVAAAIIGYHLITAFGITGAAWAQVISYAITLMLVIAFCGRSLRIHFNKHN